MIALLLAGAAALLADRTALAGLLLGLAALCRYEAWIAGALAVARRPSLRALAIFGWAPIAWMLVSRGLAPSGTYVLDLDPTAGRLWRLPYLIQKLVDYSGGAALILAACGLVVALWRGDRRWRWGALFVVGVIGVIAVVGQEYPPGTGRISERLAHVPAVVVCAAAGLLLARLAGTSMPRRLAVAALTIGIAVSWARRTDAALERAQRDPALRLAVDVADYVDRTLGQNGRVAVSAPGVPAAFLDAFIRKVEATGGDVQRARQTAATFAQFTPDGVRLAAQLARPPGTVVARDAPAALLVVFDEAAATAPPGAPLVARFTAPPRGASVYRTPAGAPAR
jgi:hypothetical protein